MAEVNRKRHRILIVAERCTGCGECVRQCPMELLALDEATHKIRVDQPFLCIGCYTCVQSCSTDATVLQDPYTMQFF